MPNAIVKILITKYVSQGLEKVSILWSSALFHSISVKAAEVLC